MKDHREIHWKVTKCILHYLKGTSQCGIKYSQSSDSLVGYTNSNCEGNSDDKKYTFSFGFHFSFGPLFWSFKKKKVVSLSTTKAKYHGAVNASTKVVWIQELLGEFGLHVESSIVIHCDNQNAIQVANNPISYSKIKHVELHAHYLRHLVQERFSLLFVARQMINSLISL